MYDHPIEDTELFSPEFESKRPKALRPKPCFEIENIAEEHKLSLVQSYAFLYAYGPALKLYPFIFQDFLLALDSKKTQSLIPEIFGSLLAVACKEYQGKFDSNTGLNRYALQFPAQDENGNWSSNKDESELIGALAGAYQEFNVNERAAVDQWYKWRPGQWLHVANEDTDRSVARLKAWPVALFGLVRDWFQSEPSIIKWNILYKILFTNEIEEDDPLISEETIDNASISMIDESGNSNESMLPNSSRKRRAENSEITKDDFVRRKRVTRSRAAKESGDNEITRAPKKEIKKKAPKPQKGKKNEMLFEDLCTKMERGVRNLSADERVVLINFLTEVCSSESDPIRIYRDACSEKVTELKKEQRELARSRKLLASQILDLSKRLPTKLVESISKQDSSQILHGEDANVGSGACSEIDGSVSLKSDEPNIDSAPNNPLPETKDAEQIEMLKVPLFNKALKIAKATDLEQERREQVLKYEIRKEQGVARVKPLGKDRFCNRYWWFDGSLGAISMDSITNIQITSQVNPDPIIAQEFATGYIFVEEVIHDETNLPTDLFEPLSDLRAGSIDGKLGFYNSPEQVGRFNFR